MLFFGLIFFTMVLFLFQKNTWENYNKISFKPNDFTKFLLSKEIGFSTCKTVAMPNHKSKGFRRPILLFTKLESKADNQAKEESNLESAIVQF